MKMEIIEEHGFYPAMKGLSRSFNQPLENMPQVALRLASKDGGHNKFLESMVVWLDIEAPRFWWSEFDTYRAGVTKQSDSTMHTLKRQPLTQDNFEYFIRHDLLSFLNDLISDNSDIEMIKTHLPEGFLQGRTVCLNYKTVRNIILQRHKHRLPQWRQFCEFMIMHLKYSDYLGLGM